MIAYDLNHYGLDDSLVRISVQSGTAFSLGWSVRVANVPSLAGGNLKLSKAQKNARTLPLAFMVYGDTDAQLDARLGALANLLDQPTLILGRSVDGVRTEAEVELVSVQDQAEYDAGSKTAKTGAVVSLNGVYWRDETASIVELPVGQGSMTALSGSTAPIIDAKLLVQGDDTANLIAFSIQDDNSQSGVRWSEPDVSIGDFKQAISFATATVGRWASGQGIAVDSYGNRFVIDGGNDVAIVVGPDGDYVGKFGNTGGNAFFSPTGIAIDAADNIYIADTGRDRIYKYTWNNTTKTASLVTFWGTSGSGNTQFHQPSWLAVDSTYLYVSDTGNDRIVKYTFAGSYVTKWGTTGSGTANLDTPLGIAVNAGGNIAVADQGNGRIIFFTATGAFVSQIIGIRGVGIAFAPNGNMFVTQSGTSGNVTVSDPSGILVAHFGDSGSGNGQFASSGGSSATGLYVDVNNDVWILDAHRLQKFDGDGVPSGLRSSEWLLIDIAARSVQIVHSADFDARGDTTSGLDTVPWAGKKLRLSPSPGVSDLLSRELSVTVQQTGGGTALLQAKNAYL